MSKEQEQTLRLLIRRPVFDTLNAEPQAFIVSLVAKLADAVTAFQILLAVALVSGLYDAMMAFSAERKYIWSAKWSLTKVLYIWIRCIHSCGSGISLVLTQYIWRPEQCDHLALIMPIAPILVTPASQFLLLMRARVLWQNSTWATVLLVIPWLSHIGALIFIVWEAVGTRVPILGAFGPCIPASKRSNGLGMLMGATTALLFEVLATLLIIIVCAKTWYDRRATHMHGGVSLITVIMRESVGFWLCVVCIHGGNIALIIVDYSRSDHLAVFSVVSASTSILLTLRITLNLKMETDFEAALYTKSGVSITMYRTEEHAMRPLRSGTK